MNNSDLDVSHSSEMTKDELQVKLQSVIEKYKFLEFEIEKKNQLLYDYSRQVSVYEQLEKEFHQEIDSITSENKIEIHKYDLKIQTLEENINELTDKNQYLETCLFEKEEEKIQLKIDIKDLTEKIQLTEQSDDTHKLQCEIEKLTEEVENYRSDNENLIKELDLLKEETTKFENKYSEMYKELEITKENLHCKKQELQECKTLCSNLQEDLILTRNELDQLKSKPLDKDVRGNSLFAEVNDKRLEAQNEVAKMKQIYLKIRRDYNSVIQKNAELINKNSKLAQELQENNRLINKDYNYIISTLESRVKTLEKLVEKFKYEIEEKEKSTQKNYIDDVYQFIEDMTESKNKEIADLKELLNSESQARLQAVRHLTASSKELREWKAISESLKCKQEELEQKILELEKNEKRTTVSEEVIISDNLNECDPSTTCPKMFRNGEKLLCEVSEITTLKSVILDIKSISSSSEEEHESKNMKLSSCLKNIDFSRFIKKERNTENYTTSDTHNDSNDNKENLCDNLTQDKKVVTFSSETVDSSPIKPQTLIKGRKGKILNSKTWYIPSKPSSN